MNNIRNKKGKKKINWQKAMEDVKIRHLSIAIIVLSSMIVLLLIGFIFNFLYMQMRYNNTAEILNEISEETVEIVAKEEVEEVVKEEVEVKEQEIAEEENDRIYGISFAEGMQYGLVKNAVIDIYEDEGITGEQFENFNSAYMTLIEEVRAKYEISEDILSRYNDNIRAIFGEQSEYLMSAENEINIHAWYDGYSFYEMDKIISDAYFSNKISYDAHEEYEENMMEIMSDTNSETYSEYLEYSIHFISEYGIDMPDPPEDDTLTDVEETYIKFPLHWFISRYMHLTLIIQ